MGFTNIRKDVWKDIKYDLRFCAIMHKIFLCENEPINNVTIDWNNFGNGINVIFWPCQYTSKTSYIFQVALWAQYISIYEYVLYMCISIVWRVKIFLICLRIYGTKAIKNNNTNSKIFSGIASLGGIRGMVLSCISFCLQCEISRYTTWHINHFCMSDKFQ